MKTKHIITSLLLTSFFVTQSQTTQKRETKPFNAIDASGASNVIYTPGDSLSIIVEGYNDEIAFIETSIHNDILFIKTNGTFKHPFKIKVTGTELNHLTMSGASTFSSTNEIKSDSMNIESGGAARIDLALSARSVRATIGGASDVTLSGNTINLIATINGASSLKAYKLNSMNTSVSTSGASNAKVFASQKISANATGASSIKFKGDPKEVSAEGSSASQVIKIGSSESNKKLNSGDSTTTEFNFGKKHIIIIDKENEHKNINTINSNTAHEHWAGFSMGSAGFLSPKQSFSIDKPYNYMELDYSKSFNFQFNLGQHNFHLYKKYINLVTGIGFDFARYEFNNKTRLNADSSFTWGKVDSTAGFSYSKNRFKSTYVTVPLILDFNTSKNTNNNFHISAGVVGKYLLRGKTKQVYNEENHTIKNIRKDNYNLNPFRFDAYASIGYRNVTVYAQYALNQMFKNNQGPELYPFSIGIRLLPFD